MTEEFSFDELLEEVKSGKELTGKDSVLTDLQNHGVKDILIASVDGLAGFPEAIATIFPKTEVQLCIVHQIRNSLIYVGSKHQRAFMRDLKPLFTKL